jgi:sulfite reductase alpha subunit
MSKKQHDTPMLDQLESGPWPSFVTGLKRLAKDNDYMTDLMGQLEHSYKTRKGYWKGGTVGVFGYGGGVIPRFSEVAEMFPASKEFHTLRVQPPAGMHYNTDVLRKMCDIWEKHGSGLIAFHGQSGDIMFQGASTANVQGAFDELNELGFDLGGAGPAVRTSCPASARHVASNRASTKPGRTGRSSIHFWTTCTVRHCLTSSSSSSRAARTTV